MNGPVDTPTVVDLEASAGIASTPPSVTIPAGQNSATFTVTTSSVTSAETVFIEAMIIVNNQLITQVQSANITITL